MKAETKSTLGTALLAVLGLCLIIFLTGILLGGMNSRPSCCLKAPPAAASPPAS